jgi:hypothetical protein
MEGDEKFSVLLLVIGSALFAFVYIDSGLLRAIAITGAYYTCCLMIYSFLVKVWKVSRGKQTLDGLKWTTLIMLALTYGVMSFYGQNNGIPLLTLPYIFAESCCLMTIGYKLLHAQRVAQTQGRS